MSTIKPVYGASTTITCTLTSLANNAAHGSLVVDNATDLFEDALVQVKTKTATGTSATGIINVYAYASADDGTTYGDTAGGTDAAVTLTVPPNLRLIGTINAVAASTAYKSNPMSVAAAFGGVLPKKWGIVIENKSGGALSATAGDHAISYQGVQHQVV